MLMLLRAGWTLLNVKPLLPVGTPSWQRSGVRIVHFLLYVFLILMPLSGWLMSVAAGRAPTVWHWTLNLPVPRSDPLSDAFFSLHSWTAIFIIVFVSIHVLATLYHFLVKKDDVLQSII
jgi:cytochrome b561